MVELVLDYHTGAPYQVEEGQLWDPSEFLSQVAEDADARGGEEDELKYSILELGLQQSHIVEVFVESRPIRLQQVLALHHLRSGVHLVPPVFVEAHELKSESLSRLPADSLDERVELAVLKQK